MRRRYRTFDRGSMRRLGDFGILALPAFCVLRRGAGVARLNGQAGPAPKDCYLRAGWPALRIKLDGTVEILKVVRAAADDADVVLCCAPPFHERIACAALERLPASDFQRRFGIYDGHI